MKNFIALFLFLSAFPVFSLPLRNITALVMERYPDGEDVYTLENTLIAGVSSRFSLLGRVRLREASREGEWNRGGTFGLIYLLGPYTYGESTYGIYFEGEEALSHHVSSEISLEKERFLLIGGIKGQLSPEQSTFFSSLAGRYFFVPSFSLWGKYMFIYDTATKAGHSLWAEAAVDPLPGLQVRFGGTAADSDPEYSLLGGLRYTFRERFRIGYQFQYTDRFDYQLHSHSIIVDLRWGS